MNCSSSSSSCSSMLCLLLNSTFLLNFLCNVVLQKKRGKEKADEAKKRRILRIELSWMMMMESQRRTLRVFSLSLSRDR